eukprot:TRINITY_DN9554_c0_g2_i6.p1 TRINITY_DN9554_c0_g2~~TRINITY_DN9554_c0_g2_i6.p1  ORF type:complete len:272 (-),score=-23.63 TRINITY_DN9554_c0_g2_i6:586-1311(-)
MSFQSRYSFIQFILQTNFLLLKSQIYHNNNHILNFQTKQYIKSSQIFQFKISFITQFIYVKKRILLQFYIIKLKIFKDNHNVFDIDQLKSLTQKFNELCRNNLIHTITINSRPLVQITHMLGITNEFLKFHDRMKFFIKYHSVPSPSVITRQLQQNYWLKKGTRKNQIFKTILVRFAKILTRKFQSYDVSFFVYKTKRGTTKIWFTQIILFHNFYIYVTNIVPREYIQFCLNICFGCIYVR